MSEIALAPALIGALCGVITSPTEPLYAAIPGPLKGRGKIIYYPEIGLVISRDDGFESTLVLKAFVSTEQEELKQLVANYFKEDNPDDLMNWLV